MTTAIGNSNQGKSYILSKISKLIVPSGYHVNTHGLSIYFPDNLTKDENQWIRNQATFKALMYLQAAIVLMYDHYD